MSSHQELRASRPWPDGLLSSRTIVPPEQSGELIEAKYQEKGTKPWFTVAKQGRVRVPYSIMMGIITYGKHPMQWTKEDSCFRNSWGS
jgi:hypothetical protein